MTKNEIIKQLAKQNHITQEQAAQTVNSFIDILKDALQNGEKILLSGFGTFSTKARNPRNSFNFLTGETKITPQKRVITFSPAGNLARAVEEGADKQCE